MTQSFKKNSSVAFNEAYASLNATQKESVDTTDGPVMVVAGPGTGKTQILTLRIANILLETDTAPDSILALTFTESGAKAMRERLRKYIGATAYQVPIFTFHGFAKMLISYYPDAYDRVIGGRPAGDLEKVSLIESILEGGKVKILRPLGNTTYYVSPILHTISQMKQEYITPDSLVLIVNQQENLLAETEKYHTKGAYKGKVRSEYTKLEKNIEKNRELITVYKQYEALLSEQNLYDFDDMIVETVKALEKDEDMLRDLQEKYQYILADEHQDVNGSQNKILELLASFHDSPNIFVVGDEKQAIYRFQGASLENFLYFKKKFKDTSVISLTQNYRSGQAILDPAYSLVEVEDGPLKDLRIPLNAESVKESSVTSRNFTHQAIEDSWVVDEIKKQIEDGISPKEIAIIVRTNKEVEVLASLLRKSGITVTASADGDILRHPITEVVRGMVDAVVVDRSESALFSLLHGAYWNIDPDDLIKVLSHRAYNRSLWSILSNNKRLSELKLKNVAPFLKVVEVIVKAREMEVHEAPQRVVEFLLQETGFLDHLMEHDPLEGTRVVRRLYDEIEELVLKDGFGNLREVGEIFKARMDHNLALNAPFISINPESVQVMTAHKSKGLEFESVFMPHVTDSGWSGSTKRRYFNIPFAVQTVSEEDFIEDERRLMYVAMTRAKRFLQISYSETNAEGKELFPSRLLEDISKGLIKTEETKKVESDFNPIDTLRKPIGRVSIDSQLLRHLLEERGFSATSLNNYLRSPWDYFYRNVLRIPETQPAHMQYGTAIHNTLEHITRKNTEGGKLPDNNVIKKKLEAELDRLPLSAEEYVRLLEKGLEELVIYREHLLRVLPRGTKEELSLRVLLETGIPELPELPLTGKLDRIDLDEGGYAKRVVDYKTGKPKSRNEIEGKTKNSDGGYKRQLVFYALLLSLHDDERYLCREGVLSFVQGDAKGRVREETFIVTDEEIEELKSSIISATKDIISGKFLEYPCDDKISDYCHLVELLRR
ncbi:ATP-dependent helicase [Candidatus Kaiserbacteria bacterium]|nr:ATP-dependent helicase [Candidatus Kaiserbacteria bacterium]USN91908.1 MAG: ATP-dependent helicase [Candidatus Nomurabacteria bacterium]